MGLMEVGGIGGHSSDSIEDILGDKGAEELKKELRNTKRYAKLSKYLLGAGFVSTGVDISLATQYSPLLGLSVAFVPLGFLMSGAVFGYYSSVNKEKAGYKRFTIEKHKFPERVSDDYLDNWSER